MGPVIDEKGHFEASSDSESQDLGVRLHVLNASGAVVGRDLTANEGRV